MWLHMRLRRQTTIIALPLLALLAIAVAWFLGLGTPGMMNLPRPFDSERWKAAHTLTKVRCGMVADLRYRVGLVGRSEADVLELLGDDDDERTGPPTFYVLCPDLIDFYFLEIKWKDGRVASTGVGLT